jgi:hypothetical protein
VFLGLVLSIQSGLTIRICCRKAHMKILKVPYAEKDQAKALGARWNSERKTWYVPDGVDSAPFGQWLQAGDGGGAAGSGMAVKARVDAHAGEPVVGALYVALEHDCNPFAECAQCAPILEKSGWSAAHATSKALLRSI